MSKKKRCFLIALICSILLFAGCTKKYVDAGNMNISSEINWNSLNYDHSMELLYAENFSVDYYEGGYALITIAESGKYLVVPENKATPSGLDADIIVLKKPIDNIYLVATSAMDLFCSLDSLDSIGFTGTNADKWYIQKAKEAVEKGDILYAGKYSAPDYELIVSQGCDLAVESTMLYHTPEVKEKLEEFDIPVMVERSSYEPHPLGRMEWIKLYAVLLGKEEFAEKLMEEQTEKLNEIKIDENSKKTVAFFYISNAGYVNVRKSGDYISKMIQLAGGNYIFDNLGEEENALSTVNMQMESFYAQAKEADILIYNSTIDGELENKNDLLEKSPLLKDFRAVQEGNVWCTTKNMFQETMSIGDLILDFNTVIQSDSKNKPIQFLYRLQ